MANETGLQPSIVEKDYVLGWLLAAINANDALLDSWVFKGGTCLKKCYFETYRFSEDLDFTLTDVAHLEADFLARQFSKIAEGFYIGCYDYPELFGEKVRALGERGRPRDLYDVINLYQNDQLPSASIIRDVLQQKCKLKV